MHYKKHDLPNILFNAIIPKRINEEIYMSQLTKRAIEASFIKLLNEKPFDKITVKDIVEDCGINRNTFYYHYQDIYALLTELFDAEAAKILNSDMTITSLEEGIISATQFVIQNKRAIYHIYNSINREKLYSYLCKVAESIVSRFVRKQAEGLVVSDLDFEIIISLFTYSIVGVIFKWLESNMEIAPEAVIRRLAFLAEGQVRFMLERAAGNPT